MLLLLGWLDVDLLLSHFDLAFELDILVKVASLLLDKGLNLQKLLQVFFFVRLQHDCPLLT